MTEANTQAFPTDIARLDSDEWMRYKERTVELMELLSNEVVKTLKKMREEMDD